MERILVDTYSPEEFTRLGRAVETLAERHGLRVSYRVTRGPEFHGVIVTESEELVALCAGDLLALNPTDDSLGGDPEGRVRMA